MLSRTACPLASVPLEATLHMSNVVVCAIFQFRKGFSCQLSYWLGLTLLSVNTESNMSGQSESKLLARQW